MTATFIDQATDQLQPYFRGDILTPFSPGYDDARLVWNGVIDRKPAIIAQCTSALDVAAAVNFARANDLLVSIRGGGHNVAGNAVNDGGLVIDLSPMREVTVDPETMTAHVQGGATWADVDKATQAFGLAAPGGKVSTTGVAGFTLHGGMSWMMRDVGLALDNLRSVQIVTADGVLRTASEAENPDLFWAIRGAGSNFGVVTSFEFALQPIGNEVAVAAVFYDLEDAPQVLSAYLELASGMPDEASTIAAFWSVPAHENFPEDLHGKPVILLAGMYSGDIERGEALMKPFRDVANPLLDLSGPWPYQALQSAFDPFFATGGHYYFKSLYLKECDEAAQATMIRHAQTRPAPEALIVLWQLGGAMGRVPDDATAFGKRGAPYLYSLDTVWTDPADNERCIAWSRDAWASMQPHGTGGLYLNFGGFGEEKEALARAAYGPNFDRLVELKTKYDPGNLFRMNQNIPPRT
ncbi:MAG: FAD-binding oxidoreductase [Thermomicrobiales bacterium]